MTTAVAEPTQSGSKVEQEGRRFLILGCGPAALIAARTLEINGFDTDDFRIVAQRVEASPISGAQFLHRPILGDAMKPDGFLTVTKIGFADSYSAKVYGERKATSFETMQSGQVGAWSLIKEYERLWEDYEPGIEAVTITPEVFNELAGSADYDEVISTIPPQAYCSNPAHTFPAAEITLGDPLEPLPLKNWIVYNGRPEDPWYRMSNIFGEPGVEFGPLSERQEEAAADLVRPETRVRGKKPLGTNCDCGYRHESGTNLLRVGRFGQWDRKRLLHQVPSQVAAIL